MKSEVLGVQVNYRDFVVDSTAPDLYIIRSVFSLELAQKSTQVHRSSPFLTEIYILD